jgi:pimeloyl-ACP methyl ester carboxylesterase
MNIFIKTISWAAIIYLAYCALLFLLQRQMMFPRYMIDVPKHSSRASGIETIWIDTGRYKIESWFLPPKVDSHKQPFPVVIFAHGNGEIIDFWPLELQKFNQLGIGVLLVEYPGYGRSKGAPSQKSITETFTKAYDIMAAREDIDPSKIILFGRSLGGGAVCALADKRPSAALILMSTFTSARSFASKYLAPPFLVRDPFDNLAVVGRYPEPVLVVHGKFDEVIPYSHGSALHQAARQGKMITYDSGHNDCPPRWDIFWSDVASFLKEWNLVDVDSS